MKNKKYEFSQEQKVELNSLRNLFDTIMECENPELFNLIKMDSIRMSKKQCDKMCKMLREFDNGILNSELRSLFLRMIYLAELEGKYNKQEFIQKLFDNENYELLAFLKKKNQLK